jgi:hypothetical protein
MLCVQYRLVLYVPHTASSREGMTGVSPDHTAPPPAPTRGGGRHGLGRRRPYAGTKATPYILVFFTGPLKPRPHICKPPGRFTRGLTGHYIARLSQ